MNAREYYRDLPAAIHAAPYVWRSELRFEEVDEHECYVSGNLLLVGEFELHIAEYVITEPTMTRPKYRYHLQTPGGRMLSRWDNAPHHRDVVTFPDHRHDDQGHICPHPPSDLPGVLNAVVSFILPSPAD